MSDKLSDEKRESLKYADAIEGVERLSEEQIVDLLLKSDSTEHAERIMRAWSWRNTFEAYMGKAAAPEYLVKVFEANSYELWQWTSCLNGFVIVDTETGFCHSDYGYRVIAYYIRLSKTEKRKVTMAIQDAEYERGQSGFQRYEDEIQYSEIIGSRDRIKGLLKDLKGKNFGMKCAPEAPYVTFMLKDEEGNYWYTMSYPSALDPMLFTRIEG